MIKLNPEHVKHIIKVIHNITSNLPSRNKIIKLIQNRKIVLSLRYKNIDSKQLDLILRLIENPEAITQLEMTLHPLTTMPKSIRSLINLEILNLTYEEQTTIPDDPMEEFEWLVNGDYEEVYLVDKNKIKKFWQKKQPIKKTLLKNPFEDLCIN